LRIVHDMHADDAPSSEDWLSSREIAELLDVSLRTVQNSFADPARRAQWWEPEISDQRVRAWRRKPLTVRAEYQARRWAVDRLAEQGQTDAEA
jgi:hypothetical protein